MWLGPPLADPLGVARAVAPALIRRARRGLPSVYAARVRNTSKVWPSAPIVLCVWGAVDEAPLGLGQLLEVVRLAGLAPSGADDRGCRGGR